MSRHNVHRATSRLDGTIALLCLVGAILVAMWCATSEQPPDTTDRLEYEMPQ